MRTCQAFRDKAVERPPPDSKNASRRTQPASTPRHHAERLSRSSLPHLPQCRVDALSQKSFIITGEQILKPHVGRGLSQVQSRLRGRTLEADHFRLVRL